MIKFDFLKIVREIKHIYDLYVMVNEEAKKRNKIVLRLPPYHCELNPIELKWSEIIKKWYTKSDTRNVVQFCFTHYKIRRQILADRPYFS